jgi:ABC-type uncharacterized transport system substrate-binding protein
VRRARPLLTRSAALLAVLGFLLGPGVAAAQTARAPAPAASPGSAPTKPIAKPGGGKWRIGYYEGGQYPDYEVILKATIRGLVTLGWMEPLDLPRANNPEPGGFWRTLANGRSRYLEFVPDAYYAAGDFDAAKRPAVRAELIERLKTRRDLDLVIAMGTWAGQDLATAEHAVPTIVMSSSDPIASRIVRSADDSGFPHLHAKVEPDRYQRQLRLFHEIVPFKRLGLVHEDSVEGRTFGGVAAVEEVARERGFTVVTCHAAFSGVSRAQAEEAASACYEQVAKQADAVYVTVHRGVTARSLPRIVAALTAAKVPSFSMLGSVEVRKGILMSIAQADFSYVGHFHAETIARVFNGAKPGQLAQRWEDPAKIALNIRTAQQIGFNPPVDVLLAADEIYETIEAAEPAPTR